MIFNLIKSRQPISFVLFPLLVIALWLPAFLSEPEHTFTNLMPLYELFVSVVGGSGKLALIIGVLLVVAEGLLLNRIIDTHKILPERNNLVAFFYILFSSIHTSFLYANPVLLANLFIILALGQLLTIYNQKSVLKEVFNASVLISIASLFYFPSILMILLIWATFIIIRPLEWRNYILSLLGPLLVGIWLASYYFLTDQLPVLSDKYLQFNNYFEGLTISGFSYVVIGFLIIIALVAFGSLLKGLSKNTVRVKNLLRVVSFFFVFSLLTFLLTNQDYFSTYAFVLVSFAIYTANYFDYLKRYWIGNSLIILLIVFVLYNNYRLIGLF